MIRAILSDGENYVKVNIQAIVSQRTTLAIKVFPTAMSAITRYHLANPSTTVAMEKLSYQIVAPPLFGNIVETNRFLGAASSANHSIREFSAADEPLAYEPVLSDEQIRELCTSMANSLRDSVTISVHDTSLNMTLRTFTIDFDISFHNLAAALKEADFSASIDIRVNSGSTVPIGQELQEKMLAYDAFKSCPSAVKLGLTIMKPPSAGEVMGLDKDGVVWWDTVVDNQLTYKHDGASHGSDSVLLSMMLEQNTVRYLVDDVLITVNIMITSQAHRELVARDDIVWQIRLMQGTFSVNLSSEVFKLRLPSLEGETLALKASPQCGEIVVAGVEGAKEFTLKDLTQGKVQYHMTDQTASADEFSLEFTGSDAIIVKCVVEVQPNLLSDQPAIFSSKKPQPITLSMLDASPLLRGNLTGDDVTYDIIRPLQHGSLRLAEAKAKRSVDDVAAFTHSDIAKGRIILLPPDDPAIAEDSFTYILQASGTQPAEGLFKITYSTPHSLADNSEIQGTSSENNDRTIIALAVVLSVLVSVMVFVIVAVCLRKIHNKKRLSRSATMPNRDEPRLILAKENGSYKLLLAGCEDFVITPHSVPSSPTRQVDSTRRSEISHTVPEVRITPLITSDGECFDIHDYENFDDIVPCRTSPRHSSVSDTGRRPSSSRNSSMDLDNLPPIYRPKY